jgi:hypothetical protein
MLDAPGQDVPDHVALIVRCLDLDPLRRDRQHGRQDGHDVPALLLPPDHPVTRLERLVHRLVLTACRSRRQRLRR